MLGKSFRFLFRYKWRMLAIVLVLFALATPFAYRYACQIAQQKLIEEISRVHQDKVDVGSTSLGWNRLTAEDITFESEDPAIGKWCKTKKLEVRLDPLSAVFSGDPKIQSIVIQQPQIDIHLDENGKVLNDFVASDREQNDLTLKIEDGTCLISQPGRKTLSAEQIQLSVESQASNVEVKGTIGNVLDSKIAISAKSINGTTTTRFGFENFPADSEELLQLPLISPERFSGFESQGRLDGKLELTFQKGKMVDFHSEIQPAIKRFKIEKFNDTFTNIDSGSLVLTPDFLELKNLKIECLGGSTTYSGKMQKQNKEWSGEMDVQAKSVQLERLVEVLDLGFDMRGPTGLWWTHSVNGR